MRRFVRSWNGGGGASGAVDDVGGAGAGAGGASTFRCFRNWTGAKRRNVLTKNSGLASLNINW